MRPLDCQDTKIVRHLARPARGAVPHHDLARPGLHERPHRGAGAPAGAEDLCAQAAQLDAEGVEEAGSIRVLSDDGVVGERERVSGADLARGPRRVARQREGRLLVGHRDVHADEAVLGQRVHRRLEQLRWHRQQLVAPVREPERG